MRSALVVGLIAASAVAFGPRVDACGDKSLSPGGIRYQRARAAMYPATILIYAQPNSRMAAAARELKLQDSLRTVGYRYREVNSLADLDSALASGQFNVVMADFADMADVQNRIAVSISRPATVGIAYKLTKAEAHEAAKVCRFIIKVPSRAAQYFNTITDAVRSRNRAG